MTTNAQVLVLNRGFQPVAVAGVKRAFGLLYEGTARALDEEYRSFDFESWAELGAEAGDDVIHTVDRALKVPRIVVLQTLDRMPRTRIRFSRQNIYLRDSFTCQYCTKVFPRHQLNLDHVNPRSQGGKTSWENVVCSCVPCNLTKGGRTPEQAGMKLLRQPKKPTWNLLVPKKGSLRSYKEWLPFLDPKAAAYWNTELQDEAP